MNYKLLIEGWREFISEQEKSDQELKRFQSILGNETQEILDATAVRRSYLHFDGRKLRFMQGGSSVKEWSATSGGGDATATRGVPAVETALNKMMIKKGVENMTYSDFSDIFKSVAKEKGWDVDENVTDSESLQRRGVKAGDIIITTKHGARIIKAGALKDAYGILARALRSGDAFKKQTKTDNEKSKVCTQFKKVFNTWISDGKGNYDSILKVFDRMNISTPRIEDFLDYCGKPRQMFRNGNNWGRRGGMKNPQSLPQAIFGTDSPNYESAFKLFVQLCKKAYLAKLQRNPNDLMKLLSGPRMKAEFTKMTKVKLNKLGRLNTFQKNAVSSGASLSFYEEIKNTGPIPEGIYQLDVKAGNRGLQKWRGNDGKSSGEWQAIDALGYMFARHTDGVYNPETGETTTDEEETQKLKDAGKSFVPGLDSPESGEASPTGAAAGSYEKFYGKSRHSRLAWGKFRIRILNDVGSNRRQKRRVLNLSKIFGRGGFFIHGGSNPGSSGCVDLGNEMESFAKWYAAYAKRHRTPLRLVVSYSSEMMTALANAMNGNSKALNMVFDKRKDVARVLAGNKVQRDVEKNTQFPTTGESPRVSIKSPK